MRNPGVHEWTDYFSYRFVALSNGLAVPKTDPWIEFFGFSFFTGEGTFATTAIAAGPMVPYGTLSAAAVVGERGREGEKCWREVEEKKKMGLTPSPPLQGNLKIG